MSTAALVPANTKRAWQTALNSFASVLQDEKTDSVESKITRRRHRRHAVILDKYAMFLAQKQCSLASCTMSACFGYVKNHYLDLFGQQRGSYEKKKLAKIASTLDKHCTVTGDSYINKAPACRPADLHALAMTLFKTATTSAV